jgi:hypothetical protein
MSYGYQQQQPQAPAPSEADVLDARRKEAWFAYSELPCKPGWTEASKEAAAAAARAQYAMDKANGYLQPR